MQVQQSNQSPSVVTSLFYLMTVVMASADMLFGGLMKAPALIGFGSLVIATQGIRFVLKHVLSPGEKCLRVQHYSEIAGKVMDVVCALLVAIAPLALFLVSYTRPELAGPLFPFTAIVSVKAAIFIGLLSFYWKE